MSWLFDVHSLAGVALVCLAGIVAAMAWATLARWLLQLGQSPDIEEVALDPYQVAGLRGGAYAIVDTAVVALLHDGRLLFKHAMFAAPVERPNVDTERGPYRPTAPEQALHPIEQAVLDVVSMAPPVSLTGIHRSCLPTARWVMEPLSQCGLLLSQPRSFLRRLVVSWPVLALAGLLSAQAALDLSAGRLTWWQILLPLVLGLIYGIGLLLPWPAPSRRGFAQIELLCRKHRGLEHAARRGIALSRQQLLLTFALFDSLALDHTSEAYRAVRSHVRKNDQKRAQVWFRGLERGRIRPGEEAD